MATSDSKGDVVDPGITTSVDRKVVVPFLQVRVVHLDSTDTPQGPIIRVFGPTRDGQSACVYIKDFFPFVRGNLFYVGPNIPFGTHDAVVVVLTSSTCPNCHDRPILVLVRFVQ